MPASRQATGVGLPCAIDTSIWRSNVTICSALNLFFGMTSSFPSSFSHNAWSRKARAGHYRGAIEHFLNCLASGAPFETSPADNLETLKLVEDAYARN